MLVAALAVLSAFSRESSFVLHWNIFQITIQAQLGLALVFLPGREVDVFICTMSRQYLSAAQHSYCFILKNPLEIV